MTTSRTWVLAAVLGIAAAGMAGAQSFPKDLPWAVAQLSGEGDWTLRLPQLLVRSWEDLPDHRLTEAEQSSLRQKFLDDSQRTWESQRSQAVLALDAKRLVGLLPAGEPEATNKTLADLVTKLSQVRDGTLRDALPPSTLDLRGAWPTGPAAQPWPWAYRADLVAKSQAAFVVTGSVRSIADHLSVRLELYSVVEDRVLAVWEDRFATDEAETKMAEASDRFREPLLGRPWAGVAFSASLAGTRVRVNKLWHDLPWATDELEPGALAYEVLAPGRPAVSGTVTLLAGQRTTVVPQVPPGAADRLVLETEPAGASLYLDSQYLGPSPQTIDRPGATTRIRAQMPGLATLAWEVGPSTLSPSRGVLAPATVAVKVGPKKDAFYWSLAAFSASLTTSAFVGAWFDEQVKLTNAYVPSTATSDVAYQNYLVSSDHTSTARVAYASSIVLTCGVFVWMMFELGDYLGTAQATLP